MWSIGQGRHRGSLQSSCPRLVERARSRGISLVGPVHLQVPLDRPAEQVARYEQARHRPSFQHGQVEGTRRSHLRGAHPQLSTVAPAGLTSSLSPTLLRY